MILKKLFLSLMVVLFGLALAQKVGEAVPNFKLLDDAGLSIGPSDFLGKPLILNAWASWCEPCVEELPFFQRVYDELNTNAEELTLQFLLINNNEEADKALAFLRHDLNISLATGLDASKEQRNIFAAKGIELDTTLDVVKTLRIRGMPTTFFIDAEGIIRAIKVGFLTPVELPGLLATIGIDWQIN
jgi:thiol-disulfide isomerase/thioredoxin